MLREAVFSLIPPPGEGELVAFPNWYKGFLKRSGQLSTRLVQLHPNCSPCSLLISNPPSRADGHNDFSQTHN